MLQLHKQNQKSGTAAPICPETDVARYSHPQKKSYFFFPQKTVSEKLLAASKANKMLC